MKKRDVLALKEQIIELRLAVSRIDQSMFDLRMALIEIDSKIDRIPTLRHPTGIEEHNWVDWLGRGHPVTTTISGASKRNGIK